ncbi:hypothetical protein JD844_018938 [Phrynosoma platyrhinos]|uniref:Uncharacterized protein n=1 Tax=Phrynosoma platyrhinos TaxID=52577 RepID=A0ABQ7SPE3_PHRPL|nr:hypothetical protein JD844_018938 [Phrynosoma platyrhinos]
MGCDGGTIPKRHELVKGPRKVEKVREEVSLRLGLLYNKDAIIEFLLDKSSDKVLMEAASHIKNIKNVIELNLTDNPAWTGDKGNTKGDKYDDIQSARFICFASCGTVGVCSLNVLSKKLKQKLVTSLVDL